ncbi:HEAT repeat domain-containing protein, partial [Streptomyces mesophilus]|uniref:HEAT repeat domain-containing protein n=1 Tax=Streptomyces mesophilus TaxID=1775132 RepID=UPI003328986F
VQCLAALTGEDAATELRRALTDADPAVRGHAALALGTLGEAQAVPVLVDMIVQGSRDTDAADTLSTLASDAASAEQLAGLLVERLGHETTPAPARGRLTQALAGIPGTTADGALAELCDDKDRAVALTAAYLVRLRASSA